MYKNISYKNISQDLTEFIQAAALSASMTGEAPSLEECVRAAGNDTDLAKRMYDDLQRLSEKENVAPPLKPFREPAL